MNISGIMNATRMIAQKIGVSKQTLYKYENDIITNIPSDKIELLASVLDTTPAYIMEWEEPDSDSQPFSAQFDAGIKAMTPWTKCRPYTLGTVRSFPKKNA